MLQRCLSQHLKDPIVSKLRYKLFISLRNFCVVIKSDMSNGGPEFSSSMDELQPFENVNNDFIVLLRISNDKRKNLLHKNAIHLLNT